MLKIVVGVLAVVVMMILGIGMAMPSAVDVQRSVVVKAPAATVFPYLNSPKRWTEWSAWNKENYPGMEMTYSGPESGKGAATAWEDPKSGKGRLELTSSDPNSGITYDLFFDGSSKAECAIKMEPEGEALRVTMSMQMDLPFMGRVMSAFMSFDEAIGKDFEKGLNKLQGMVEKS